jgi:hypothetical protein
VSQKPTYYLNAFYAKHAVSSVKIFGLMLRMAIGFDNIMIINPC